MYNFCDYLFFVILNQQFLFCKCNEFIEVYNQLLLIGRNVFDGYKNVPSKKKILQKHAFLRKSIRYEFVVEQMIS